MMRATKHRMTARLQGYDYARAGAYIVTICAEHRRCIFGEIVNDVMRMNEFGRVAGACWNEIPRHFPKVELDAFVVMPNHVHGIIIITEAVGRGMPRPYLDRQDLLAPARVP